MPKKSAELFETIGIKFLGIYAVPFHLLQRTTLSRSVEMPGYWLTSGQILSRKTSGVDRNLQ